MATYTQLQSLIGTIRQLLEKARQESDFCEYYRLTEELCMAEAALKTQLVAA
ncbi:MAG TPA: hypothetical protein VH186_19795 [Chloroflexia bacterium]|nr:hypothetical protein [Chloroflexia bacterium]